MMLRMLPTSYGRRLQSTLLAFRYFNEVNRTALQNPEKSRKIPKNLEQSRTILRFEVGSEEFLVIFGGFRVIFNGF